MGANIYGPLDKVAKAGDTMTGTLQLQGSPPIKVPGATTGQVLVSDSSGNMTPGSTGGGLDWVIIRPSGDTTGVTDTTAINNALTSAAAGTVVYLAAGVFYIDAPISVPASVLLLGAVGLDNVYVGDHGTVLRLTSSFSGTKAVLLGNGTAGSTFVPTGMVSNLSIDGSAHTSTAVDGIQGVGNGIRGIVSGVTIGSMSGYGYRNQPDTSAPAGQQYPLFWDFKDVLIQACALGGVYMTTQNDTYFQNVYVLGCGGSTGHGWVINQGSANSRFDNCRAEWSGGYGLWYTGTVWNGNGSGGCIFSNFSTDRNGWDGVRIDATGAGPVVFTNLMLRRDGRNGGSGGGGYSALNVHSAAIPITIGTISVYPGTDDNGSGTNSPQNGISVSGSSYVQVVGGGYVQAATTALSIGTGNTFCYVNPAIVTSTGTTSAPVIRAPAIWFNVITQFGADPSGTADSTAAIQAAITACGNAGGGVVWIPAGTYKLTAALTVPSNVTIAGDGQPATTLHQTGTAVNVLTITGAGVVSNVQVRDLWITGPGSGSGIGISVVAGGTNNPVEQLVLRNVTVQDMGSHGIYSLIPIVSHFDNVVSQLNGGRGFYITGVPGSGTEVTGTSCVFNACYANDNALDGYYLQDLAYSALNACAADSNGTGYVIAGCEGLTLNSCGAESTVAKNGLDGTSFKITKDSSNNPSEGIVLNGCYSLVNNAVAYWVTGGSNTTTLSGVIENGPGGSATASIKTDTGTMCTLIGYSVATGLALTSGTYNELNDGSTGEVSIAGTAYLNATNFYALVSFNSGTDTSGTATASAPSFTSGTAKQLSTTQDVMLYIAVQTAAALAVAIGPTSTPATTVMPSQTYTLGLQTLRIPKGWYVKITGTIADLTITQVTC